MLLYLQLELCGSRQQLGLQQEAHLAATLSVAPWLVGRELQPHLLRELAATIVQLPQGNEPSSCVLTGQKDADTAC